MATSTYVKALGVALFVVVVQHCLYAVNQLGIFKIVYNHAPGPCRHVGNIVNGSEDLFLLPNNKVLVTSGLRFFLSPYVENHWGSIHIVDLSDSDLPSKKLEIVGFPRSTFNPHGISAWVDKAAGKTYVFIVLHDPEAIGKFELDESGGRLLLLNLFQSPYMANVNSVLPTGADSFYFTNVISTGNSLLGRLHFLLSLPSGNIVYFNGTTYSYAFKGVCNANGIAATKDLSTIYLGAMEQLLVLSRSPSYELTLKSAVRLDFAADNVFVDEDGAVWTAGVPRMIEVMQYLDDHTKLAGSRVIKIEFNDQGHDVTDVYVNDGRQLVASTKAIFHDRHLLIGTIGHRLLHCDVNSF